MSIHKWFSIAALIVTISVFVFTPLLDATAEGNTQTVGDSISAFQCSPPILPPSWPSASAPNDNRLICAVPVGLGSYCWATGTQKTYTFHVTPSALLHVEVVTISAGLCSLIGGISSADSPCSWLGGSQWQCTAPASGEFVLTVMGAGYVQYNLSVTEIEVPELTPPDPEALAGLQRINEPASTPYIIYVPTAERAATEDTQFIDIWRLDENAIGQPLLYIAKEALLALPAYPTENLLIATSPDEVVNVYKLTTGEYQVNIGPLADGKVYTTIFDAIPPTHITHSTWVVPSE